MKQLREENLKLRKEVKHYRLLLKCQKSDVAHLMKILKDIKSQLFASEKNCLELRKCLASLHEVLPKTPCKRKRKAWPLIRSDRTKRQRICDYGHEVFKSIQENIPFCRRANLSLSLGQKTLNYSWKSKDFQNKSAPLLPPSLLDHCYASNQVDFESTEDQDEELLDIDYTSIFDSEGNWQQKHKRSLINVMDSYRISHEAYHEMRKVGKGHFPPLHHLMLEKKLMSNEIPYIKHSTVRNDNFLQSQIICVYL